MRRGFLIFVVIIVSVAVSTSAWSDTNFTQKYVSDRHSLIKIWWPSVMFTVNVDNRGNISGSGGQVKVSHQQQTRQGAIPFTTVCDTVDRVRVFLFNYYRGGHILTSPTPHKNINLCSFNERDATFNLVFPGSLNPEEIIAIYKKWLNDCQTLGPRGGQMKTKHLFEPDRFGVSIHYKARAGLSFIEYKKDIPPVILNCQPCPALNVRDRFDFKGNTVVTIAESSLVSGGIPPYTVKITRVPPGMTQHSGATLLTGTPALGSYSMGVEVTDSCRIAKNTVNKLVSLQVTDPTPPILSALSITPSTLPTTGGDVVFKVTASDNKAVTEVTAAVSRPGWGMRVFVTRVSGNEKSGVWQGTYKAPANATNQDAPYTVDFIAGDSDGNKSRFLSGTFVVKGKPGGSIVPSKPKSMYIK